jgi:uncharacterized OsmC-like protein
MARRRPSVRAHHIRRLLLLVVAAVAVPAWGAEGKVVEEKAKPSSTSYQVKVEVRELKNRVVEGKVRNHTIFVDQPKAFGADDSAPTPPETLAFALGSCFVSTGRLIALQKKLSLKSIEAVVEGELDFARALGASEEKRAGYSGLKVVVKMDTNLSPSEKRSFVEEIRSRCPMCDNLTTPTPIRYELKE